MDDFINEMFENIKNSLFKDVPDNYHNELEKGYKKFLKAAFSKVNITKENYKMIISKQAPIYNNILLRYSKEQRLSLYVKDYNFELVKNISLNGYQVALKRLNEGITINEESAIKNSNLMKKYLKDVYSFNGLSAINICEEGLLDYEYASGKSNVMSNRLRQNIPYNENKTK